MSKASADIADVMQDLGRRARGAASSLATTTATERNTALRAIAAELAARSDEILAANRDDLSDAEERQLPAAMLDRLRLDSPRVAAIAHAVEAIAELDDPLNRSLARWNRPNGLDIERVSVPLGVIGIVYESRPNVTADASALCLKSGNAVILRGGSECFRSNQAIFRCAQSGIEAVGLDGDAVQMIPTTDRAAVGYLLSSMGDWLDVVVPRGGKSLVARVRQDARVPVIGHLDGNCHVYLHASANTEMAVRIVLNAKMRRTGICGAAETVLVDRAAVDALLVPVCNALRKAGCEVRGDDAVCERVPYATMASDADWSTEYLDAVIAMRVVDNLEAAVAHISEYGSAHTESIVCDDEAAAAEFLRDVDSAIVLHNASTQFADGGEFGLGAEIGIATGRIHARGPVGAEQLTSYKYVVRGSGQVRS